MSGPHLENYKAIGFLTYTGPDPLENHEDNKPAFNVGPSPPPPPPRQRNGTLMVFHWQANDGPLLVVFGSTSSLKKQNKTLSELQLALLDPRMTCQSNKGDICKSHSHVCIYVKTCLKTHI